MPTYPAAVAQGTNATPVQPSTWNAIIDNITDLKEYYSKGLVFDVMAYGAIGDDATDDTAAIQAAIDAAAVSGGVIFFPPGIYKFSGLSSAGDYLNFEGSGKTVTTLQYTGSGTAISLTGQIIAMRKLAIQTDSQANLAMDLSAAGWSSRYVLEDIDICTELPTNKFDSGIWMHRGGTPYLRNVRIACTGADEIGSYGFKLGDATYAAAFAVLISCYATGCESGFWFFDQKDTTLIDCIVEICVVAFKVADSNAIALNCHVENLTSPTGAQTAADALLTGAANWYFATNSEIETSAIGGTYDTGEEYYIGYTKGYLAHSRLGWGSKDEKTVALEKYRHQGFANMVRNGSFEYQLTGWTEAGTGTVTEELATFKEGIASAKVVTAGGETTTLYQDVEARMGTTAYIVDENKVVSIGVWVKSDDANTTIGIKRRTAPVTWVCSTTHSGGDTWEYLTCYGTTATIMNLLRVELYCAENTTAYFDNVSAGYGRNIEPSHHLVPDTITTMDATISGLTIYEPTSAQAITAVGNTIVADATTIILNPDADYTLTSTPTIANGTAGQILYLTAANGEANIVFVQDQDSLATSNLELKAATRAISGKAMLTLMFDGTDWIEQAYQSAGDLDVIDNSNAATAGAGEDDLKTLAIEASALGDTGGLRITAAGIKAGANDNKTLKFYLGVTGITFHAAANDVVDWRFEAEIFNTAAGAQRVSWKGYNGTTLLQGYEAWAEDTTADIILKLTGECANAGDTITQTMWVVERLN